MKVYSQLEKASLENLSSDPATLPDARVWYNTTSKKFKAAVDSGVSEILRADFAQIKNYANYAALPTAGNAGRIAYLTSTNSFYYDNGTTWLEFGSSGGGGSIQWVEDSNAPITAVSNNIRVYQFQSGLAQCLYATIRVPSSYHGGQIYLRMPFYSNDTSGNVLINSVATLIRSGTDVISTSTNQRTSTNSAVTLSGGTQNIPQSLLLDLTSSSGQINSVSVSANDLIKVKLQRDTDTATSDVSVPVYGAEVTFL